MYVCVCAHSQPLDVSIDSVADWIWCGFPVVSERSTHDLLTETGVKLKVSHPGNKSECCDSPSCVVVRRLRRGCMYEKERCLLPAFSPFPILPTDERPHTLKYIHVHKIIIMACCGCLGPTPTSKDAFRLSIASLIITLQAAYLGIRLYVVCTVLYICSVCSCVDVTE